MKKFFIGISDESFATQQQPTTGFGPMHPMARLPQSFAKTLTKLAVIIANIILEVW